MEFFAEWLAQTWQLTLEAAPWLVGGFIFAGVAYVLLPAEKVIGHLGRPGLGAVLKASLIGIPLPLCSCSVIPIASSIRKRGASRGATASFLISTPESGVDSIAVSYALLGPFLALVRPVAAFITAFVAGGLVSAFEPRDDVETPPAEEPVTSCCCCHDKAAESRSGSLTTIRGALHHGLIEMFVDLAPWLLVGLLLGGLVSALLPAGFFERQFGTGLGPMLLMLVAGLPLYVCATAATPLAAALIARGLSPGAALVFLLVGPATNIATMVVVARDLGRRSLILYIVAIAVVAVLLGVVVDSLPFSATVADGIAAHLDHGKPGTVSWAFAIALLVLIANGLRIRFITKR